MGQTHLSPSATPLAPLSHAGQGIRKESIGARGTRSWHQSHKVHYLKYCLYLFIHDNISHKTKHDYLQRAPPPHLSNGEASGHEDTYKGAPLTVFSLHFLAISNFFYCLFPIFFSQNPPGGTQLLFPLVLSRTGFGLSAWSFYFRMLPALFYFYTLAERNCYTERE